LGLIDLHVDTPPIPSVILASVALVSSLNSSDPLVPWPVHVKLTSGSTHRDLIDNLSPSPFRDDVVTTVQFKVDGATVPNAVGGNNLLASHAFNAGDSGTTDLSGADLEYDFVPADYIPPAATSASLEADLTTTWTAYGPDGQVVGSQVISQSSTTETVSLPEPGSVALLAVSAGLLLMRGQRRFLCDRSRRK
jgi:hypothetical protein